MKLEPGKYYKTRDGSKAWVGCIAPEELDINDEFQVLGYVLSDGVWCQSTWDINGRLQGEECDSDPDDLVSEWTEPVKCGPDTVYLLKYECNCSRNCSMSGHEFFASKEMADYFIRQKEDQYESVEYTLQAYRRSND